MADSIRKFLFVHINKTAGSSIERALGMPFRHRTAREIIAEIGIDAWRGHFSFAVVRNPWDKVVSHFSYRLITNQTELGKRAMGFGAWVREAYGRNNPDYYDKPKMFMPQRDWVSDADGTILVDYIARFENLQSDFEEICRRIGCAASPLPHVKRSRHEDYRKMYDAETRDIVARWFEKDIREFGYKFEL